MSPSTSRKKTSFLFPIFVSILILDQLSKYLASTVGFQIVCNRGVAFGIGNVGYIVPIFVLSIIFWLLVREKLLYSRVGFVLIFGGGVSNLIDRIYFGCVRDFIAISDFPTFNLADSAITVGVIILVFSLLKNNSDRDET